MSSDDEQEEEKCEQRVYTYEERRLQRIQHDREYTYRWGYMVDLRKDYERARYDELVEAAVVTTCQVGMCWIRSTRSCLLSAPLPTCFKISDAPFQVHHGA
jgi:hypothetical protein